MTRFRVAVFQQRGESRHGAAIPDRAKRPRRLLADLGFGVLQRVDQRRHGVVGVERAERPRALFANRRFAVM